MKICRTDKRLGTLLRLRYRSVIHGFGSLPVPSRRHDRAVQAAWTAVAARARELIATEPAVRAENDAKGIAL